jgi:uncharacterized protein YkwD
MIFCRHSLAVLLLLAGAAAQAKTPEQLQTSGPSEFHTKPITVDGYFVFPEDGTEDDYRLQMAGRDDTYILKLRPDQKGWARECGTDEPVKIEGTYLDGGILVPTKMCHWYLDETAWQMVCECNRYRQAHGLQPLRPALDLLRTAFQHTWNMRHRYGFRHGGTSGWAGENIAAGQPDPDAVTRTWYNSSGHRANMLSPGYRFIGVGYYNGLWTQQFK